MVSMSQRCRIQGILKPSSYPFPLRFSEPRRSFNRNTVILHPCLVDMQVKDGEGTWDGASREEGLDGRAVALL